MARRHEIDVVAPLGLKLEHYGCQLFWLDLIATVSLADIVILAELALKVAPGEENSAGPTPAT